MTPQCDVDILVTPSPEATRRDLFLMAAEVEDAVGDRLIFSSETKRADHPVAWTTLSGYRLYQ